MCVIHVLAGSKDVLHQLHVVEHQRQPQGFWVAVKLAEDVEGAFQQSRVLWFGDVTHTAGDTNTDQTRATLRDARSEALWVNVGLTWSGRGRL